MHDRAARPTGAVKSAAAIAIEIMILLSIDLRIAQVRPRVEEKRSPEVVGMPRCGVWRVQRAVPTIERAGFRLLFSKHFARKKVLIFVTRREL